MEYTRKEILPGVWLNHLKSDKFKTACITVNLLCQLQRDTASLNALIPYVLRRGSVHYDTMEKLSARLDELYGAAIEPLVRRIGEIQTVGFFASAVEDAFLPGGQGVLEEVCSLLGELLLSPATRGGLLLPDYVDSEREKLCERIRSVINDKGSYSVRRCMEEMCCCEDYSAGRFGSEDTAEAIRYQKLSRHYKSLLQSAPVELFYCGRVGADSVAKMMKKAFATLPRGEIDYEIGTDVRLNALEDEVRSVTEVMDVTQGKLVLGFRLGECMEEPDYAAIYVFNSVFGGGTTSKLFANVRERLQLCYYASSLVDVQKGLLLVASGIEFTSFEAARDEILAQLEAIRRGEISDEELHAAKAAVVSDMEASMDSPGELEGFYLANALSGLEISPPELAELAGNVTVEQVQAIARSVECDLIYFLRGEEEEDEDDHAED